MTEAFEWIDEPTGPTRRLGAWTANLRFEEIPTAVVKHAKLCLLDSLGCGLFGSRQPWGRISAEVAVQMGGGVAALWGGGTRCGPASAAMANGTATHGFELDDIHVSSLIHPGAVTIPAALAVGETRGVSGKDFLTALVAGYEVGLRVGICAGVPHGLRGYHPTGTVGCLASSAAVASLLGLGPTAAAHALGIGATQASGLYGARMGAMAKRFHAGHAAQAGVTAGLLAERGFTGSLDAIEAPFGGFMSTLGERPDLALLTDGLSERWETGEVGFKAYAACASAHTIIDGLLDLMKRNLAADNLDRLRIDMTTVGANNVGWAYRPVDVVAAQMNGYYAAAVTLLDGEAFIEQYHEDRLADPRIIELIGKIDIRADPALDAGGPAKRHASRIEATLSDGRILEAFTEQRRGSSHNPLSGDEIIAKFHRTSGAALDDAAVGELLDRIFQIERESNLERLGVLLMGEVS